MVKHTGQYPEQSGRSKTVSVFERHLHSSGVRGEQVRALEHFQTEVREPLQWAGHVPQTDPSTS